MRVESDQHYYSYLQKEALNDLSAVLAADAKALLFYEAIQLPSGAMVFLLPFVVSCLKTFHIFLKGSANP